MREVAFTIEVVELGIGIEDVVSIYFGGIRLPRSEMVGVERSAWRLGRTSWLARPGLVIHAGCMPELAADSSEYTVLLRSRSGARVRCGYYMDVTDFPDGLGGQVQVRISTRWEDLGLDYPLPRELWMAVRARADSVDAAVSSAANVSSVLAMIISFCVNAVVEPPALHVVFNSTAGLSRREFMEVFVPDETGLPRIGRWIDVESAFAFGQAAFASPEAPRLFRAGFRPLICRRSNWRRWSMPLLGRGLYEGPPPSKGSLTSVGVTVRVRAI